MMRDDMKEILFTEEQLAARVTELAQQINKDYADCKEDIVFIGVLRGSYMFMADLTRQIEHFAVMDFISCSSYGKSTNSSGQVHLVKDLSENIEGMHVIVVEDILDTGNTLSYLLQLLQARKPASIKLATLLDKPSRRIKPIHADYVGFEIPDAFVVGYGLDYAEHYRNLPYIGVLKSEIYSK